MYTAEPAVDGEGGIDNLHQRFREEEVAIFEKHGAEVVAVWQRLDNPNAGLMLAYRDRPTARKSGKRLPRILPGMRCGKNTRYLCRQKLT